MQHKCVRVRNSNVCDLIALNVTVYIINNYCVPTSLDGSMLVWSFCQLAQLLMRWYIRLAMQRASRVIDRVKPSSRLAENIKSQVTSENGIRRYEYHMSTSVHDIGVAMIFSAGRTFSPKS